MGSKRRWEPAEVEALKRWYAFIPTRRLPEILPGRGEKGVFVKAQKLGLRKDPERLSEMGRENEVYRRVPRPDTGPPQISA